MRKLICLLLGLCFAAGLFAGCTNGKTKKPEEKTSITFAYETEPANLDVTGNNAIAAYYPERMIYSGLFKPTVNGAEKDICTDYHVEKDSKGKETIWVFTIREGVKFHDGAPLTAEDVVETFEYAKTRRKGLYSWYEKSEVVDEKTLKVYTNGTYATVPQAMVSPATYILPSEKIKEGYDFGNKPIGCGPYKLEKWAKSEYIHLVANEDYYNGAPAIKNVYWKIIPEGTSRSINLESGEVDFVVSVDPLDTARLRENEKLKVSETNGAMFTFLALNNIAEPFENEDLRKAISCAIDRSSIIKIALENYGTGIVSCIPIIMQGCTEEGANGYNVTKAKEYLKAWGGDPAAIEFDIYVSTDVRRRVAEVIQSCLNEIGIVNCGIKQVDSATLTQIYDSGEFASYISAYTSDDLMTWLNGVFYNSGTTWSQFRQAGLDMNELIRSISSIIDASERTARVTEVNKIINEKQPLVPLFMNKVLIAYNAKLQGVNIDPMGMFRVEEFHW